MLHHFATMISDPQKKVMAIGEIKSLIWGIRLHLKINYMLSKINKKWFTVRRVSFS